jgi:hypothetical protein
MNSGMIGERRTGIVRPHQLDPFFIVDDLVHVCPFEDAVGDFAILIEDQMDSVTTNHNP